MSPERPIERLLRAFVRKRREQEGTNFGLHQATRRVLQGEVLRQFGHPQKARPTGWQWVAKLWPRLAFATATLAALIAAAVFWIPTGQQPARTLNLAKHEATTPSVSVRQPSPRGAAAGAAGVPQSADKKPMAAPGGALDASANYGVAPSEQEREKSLLAVDNLAMRSAKPEDEVLSQSASRATPPFEPSQTTIQMQAQTAKGRPASLAEFPNDSVAGRDTGIQSEQPQKLALIEDRAGEAHTAASFKDAAFQHRLRAEDGLVQPATNASGDRAIARVSSPEAQVESVAKRNFLTAAARQGADPFKSVLNTFQLEQRGQDIRIVDQDGSVYTGTVQVARATPPMVMFNAPAPTTLRAAKSKQTAYGETKPADLLTDSPAAPALSWNFMVRGTNTTLRQAVVFVGNLQQNSSSAVSLTSNQAQNIVGRFQNQLSVPREAESQVPNTRLTGRARLANGAELEIDAVPQAANAETQRK